MIGFEYGNARLRARRSALLDGNAYAALVNAADLDAMLGLLATSAYQRHIEAALPRFRGLRLLDEAIRSHLASCLTDLRGFYPDQVRARLELVAERWDVRNLRTLLRGLARPVSAEAILPLQVPAGRLDAAVLAELARQPGVGAAVDLLVAWGFPTRHAARLLLSRRSAFDASHDPAVLEQALEQGFAERLAAALDAGPDDDLTAVLRAEQDLKNLLSALRLREARLREEPLLLPDGDPFLPGGSLSPAVLAAIADTDERAHAAGPVERVPLPGWREALRSWVEHADLVRLAGELEAALVAWAVGRFTAGDPLGISIPVAYTWAKEAEARNLRLVGRGLAHGVPASEIERELVVAA